MRNEIDEDYVEIQNGMKENINQILLRIVEDLNPKKSKEHISQVFQKMKSGLIEKNVAFDVIDVLYSEESLLKNAILERIEAEIIRNGKARKEK